MEKLKLKLKGKNNSYLGSVDVQSVFVPRVGEIIDLEHFDEDIPNEIDTFLVLNVNYAYSEKSCSLEPVLDCVEFWKGDKEGLIKSTSDNIEGILFRKLL